MDILIAMMAGLLAGADPPPATNAADPAGGPRFLAVTAEQLDRLIGELGHPRFAVREAATQQLGMLDPGHLPDLLAHYQAATSYELKRRLRYVVESIFCRKEIAEREGFLGISIAKQVDTSVTDPATGRRTRGVVIAKVLEGLPAEQAGLRANDVILAVDGRPVPDEPTSKGFIEMISRRRPGCLLAMHVLRSDPTPRKLTVPVGQDPSRALDGVKLEPAPPGVALGPRIVSVAPDSAAAVAGLRVNDLIDSVNDQSLAGVQRLPVLEGALRSAKPGDLVTLGVLAVEPVELSVTLGARPVEYIEPVDKVQGRARFLKWWQEQGGELARPSRGPAAAGAGIRSTSRPATPGPEISIIP